MHNHCRYNRVDGELGHFKCSFLDKTFITKHAFLQPNYTHDFATHTPSVLGFVLQMIAVTNQGYVNSEVPLVAKLLCIEFTKHKVLSNLLFFYRLTLVIPWLVLSLTLTILFYLKQILCSKDFAWLFPVPRHLIL